MAARLLSPPVSLRDKLAQLMFVRIGSNLPPVRSVEEDAERITDLLEHCAVGGLLLFNGDRDRTPRALANLQKAAAYPLLVAADIERGVGQQLRGHALFPHAMGFSRLGEDLPQFAERFGCLTAVIAREAGIQIGLAPVADVANDPRNPIIATRSPSGDADQVARFVSSYVAGCHAGGLLATAKHFPGHGNTHEDSHHTLPTVRSSRAEMERCELLPFRAAIAERVPLIMTAHVRYPGLDDSGQCATFSAKILNDVLRRDLGFSGVIVTDSLLMEGAKPAGLTESDLAVEALNSGVDLLLDVADPVQALAGLQQAVEDGRLTEDRVETACNRLWQLKARAFSSDPSPVAVAEATQQAESLAGEVARRAITRLAGGSRRLPFDTAKTLTTILFRHSSAAAGSEQPLGALLRSKFPRCDYHEVGQDASSEQCRELLGGASGADQVLLAMVVKPAAWHRFGLPPEHLALVREFARRTPCVVASLGVPEILDDFAAAETVCTFSDVAVSQAALVEYVADGG